MHQASHIKISKLSYWTYIILVKEKKKKFACKNRNLFPITFSHHPNSLEVAPDRGLVIRIHTRKNVICVQSRGGHEFLCRGGHACGGLALQRLGFQGLHDVPKHLVGSRKHDRVLSVSVSILVCNERKR